MIKEHHRGKIRPGKMFTPSNHHPPRIIKLFEPQQVLGIIQKRLIITYAKFQRLIFPAPKNIATVDIENNAAFYYS
jgi:hypothetical protein